MECCKEAKVSAREFVHWLFIYGRWCVYDSQGGHVFTPVSLFVLFFVSKLDYHGTWWKGVVWIRQEPIQLWCKPSIIIFLHSYVILRDGLFQHFQCFPRESFFKNYKKTDQGHLVDWYLWLYLYHFELNEKRTVTPNNHKTVECTIALRWCLSSSQCMGTVTVQAGAVWMCCAAAGLCLFPHIVLFVCCLLHSNVQPAKVTPQKKSAPQPVDPCKGCRWEQTQPLLLLIQTYLTIHIWQGEFQYVCLCYRGIIDKVLKRYSATWKRREDNHQKFR